MEVYSDPAGSAEDSIYRIRRDVKGADILTLQLSAAATIQIRANQILRV